ncbi:MAG: SMC-Scp complex subunit ScpB [Kiritimatiellia bacterium]|jgi:segregation and condensation protein B|nr:SMC-Scp complex subunit ScpB [Kiritimatiellia bacterium]MDP6629957.1 SMC-Scp complex subunit ScpB [Kiritimatiellia bacterium]MDP6810155.1 SMC-Scp complex subunit ScpB [Kiritimatiellia bacterium]MDP7023627.1 SMC-Scp complex subunit ScpB [Kiritimatiellia bacterium]
MSEKKTDVDAADIVDLKQILGAMIFGANRSLSIKEMKKTLRAVGEESGGPAKVYATIRESEIAQTLEKLIIEMDQLQGGMHIAEVAGGFRFQSDPQCGIWLRNLLDKGKPSRLSQPGLETLAVIAYRQPITRAQIEAIRGVSVDHVVRKLLEMQLIRISGRSELPGRPFMYATTHYFLEHFGLRDLSQLEEVNPMLKRRDAAVSVETAQKEATQPEMDMSATADDSTEAESEAESEEDATADDTADNPPTPPAEAPGDDSEDEEKQADTP